MRISMFLLFNSIISLPNSLVVWFLIFLFSVESRVSPSSYFNSLSCTWYFIILHIFPLKEATIIFFQFCQPKTWRPGFDLVEEWSITTWTPQKNFTALKDGISNMHVILEGDDRKSGFSCALEEEDDKRGGWADECWEFLTLNEETCTRHMMS